MMLFVVDELIPMIIVCPCAFCTISSDRQFSNPPRGTYKTVPINQKGMAELLKWRAHSNFLEVFLNGAKKQLVRRACVRLYFKH